METCACLCSVPCQSRRSSDFMSIRVTCSDERTIPGLCSSTYRNHAAAAGAVMILQWLRYISSVRMTDQGLHVFLSASQKQREIPHGPSLPEENKTESGFLHLLAVASDWSGIKRRTCALFLCWVCLHSATEEEDYSASSRRPRFEGLLDVFKKINPEHQTLLLHEPSLVLREGTT